MANQTPVRNTRQRAAVRAGLDHEPRFISAQDLHMKLRNAGESVGLATVYRVLAELVKAGDADSIHTEDGTQLFRACADAEGHHHHLICVDCGATVEIDPPVEAWVDAVCAKNGFTPIRHVLDVFGRCATCSSGRWDAD